MMPFSKSPLLSAFVLALFLKAGVSDGGARETVKIRDVQGIVTTKSSTDSRWSPVLSETELHIGVQIRTGPRGANAARLRFTDRSEVVIGPASSAVIEKNGEITLLRGEFEIRPQKKMSITTAAGETRNSTEPTIWRLDDAGKLSKVAKTPKWLSGFNGVNRTDTLGSLLAKVDGRDVPLSIGYHHVTVEIRDQIARTTIEQSFVNHTKARTEGVFHFPLPQDSSIAGFGMWIDNELVEADVIEKQRAREIYETILRERRDPGLLEWTGGNIFKARVFPIFPHSEKRVKITYTQVLPLQKDGTYRYLYALQSDMLRENPLRDLKVDLKVTSSTGIQTAECTSHKIAQSDLTEYAAHIQLEEQEYTPQSDFEVLVRPIVPHRRPTLVTHRRGEDGYFLLPVNLPEEAQEGSIDEPTGLNRNDSPLNLLILCDTSGSIDPSQRKAQAEAVSAIVSQLADGDRFNVATCDVGYRFWKEEAGPPSEKNLTEALDYLDERISLGWSDLGKTFADLCKSIQPNTKVIYLGDGIPATVETDPNAFASRLNQLTVPKGVSFFPVATGSTFESVVMKAIAGLGSGGSFRQISSANSPSTVATALLREMLNPGYRNLRVTIDGPVKTARIYPDTFISTEPGEQRIVVGRYLPNGKSQKGIVLISAERNGNKITWKYPIIFPPLKADHEGGDTGNSFIPRLWARKHLDILLEQGATPEIREEIVDLSVEYKIMTPYTSFLVLESDADRERFGVKRRFQMRDGERFFSDGKKEANFHLVRQQINRASEWRRNLRTQTLRELSGMGRDPLMMNRAFVNFSTDGYTMIGHGGASFNFTTSFEDGRKGEAGFRTARLSGPLNGPVYSGSRGGDTVVSSGGMITTRATGSRFGNVTLDSVGSIRIGGGFPGLNESISAGYMTDYIFEGVRDFPGMTLGSGGYDTTRGFAKIGHGQSFPITPATPHDLDFGFEFKSTSFSEFLKPDEGNAFSLFSGFKGNAHTMDRVFRREIPTRHRRLRELFPKLIHPSGHTVSDNEVDTEITDLVDSISRFETLGKVGSHITITRTTRKRRDDKVASIAKSEAVTSPGAGSWWFQQGLEGYSHVWHMFHGKLYALDRIRGLGRETEPEEGDKNQWKQIRSDFEELLDFTVRSFSPRIVEGDSPERKWLELSRKDEPAHRRILIDTERNVVLRMESRESGEEWRVTSETKEFVEFQGVTCPALIIHRPTRELQREDRFEYRESDPDFFTQREKEIEAGIVLRGFPSLPEARKREAGGEASNDDLLALTDYYLGRQQWAQTAPFFESFADSVQKEGGSDFGLSLLRTHLHQVSGQRERLRTELLALAENLSEDQLDPEVKFLRAQELTTFINHLQAGEQIEILDLLKPCYPAEVESLKWRQPRKLWKLSYGNALRYWSGISQKEQIDWWRDLAAEYRKDLNIQISLIDLLSRSGEHDAARGVYEVEVNRDWWSTAEKWRLRDDLISRLMSSHDFADVVSLMEPFVDDKAFTSRRVANYLKALSRSGKVDQASKLSKMWLADYLFTKKPDESPLVKNRAYGAVEKFCEYSGRSGIIKTDNARILRETAVVAAKSEDHLSLAINILNQYRFKQSDQWRETAKRIGDWLLENIDSLTTDHLRFGVSYSELTEEEWASVRKVIQSLEENAKDVKDRTNLLATLYQYRDRLFQNDDEARITFLKKRISEAEDERAAVSRRIEFFNDLIAGSRERSDEELNRMYSLLGELHLSGADNPVPLPVDSLLQLNDRAFFSAKTDFQSKEKKSWEDMSRKEQTDFQKEMQWAASAKVVALLNRQIELQKNDTKWKDLLPWLNLERIYFTVGTQEPDLSRLLAECLNELGESPASWQNEEDPIVLFLKERTLDTALYLATETFQDSPQPAAQLVSFLRKGRDLKDQRGADYWHQKIWNLLLATRANQQLEEELKIWIRDAPYNTKWRIGLVYLLIEQDEIAEAKEIFRGLEKDEMLAGEDAKTYALLQQATGEKTAMEDSLRGFISQSQLNTLTERIRQIRTRVQSRDGGATGSLEQEEIDLIAELMERSPSVRRHAYDIRMIYRETKDPRLTGPMIRALLGGSIQQAYPMLREFASFAEMIEEEASVDESMKEITKIRKVEDRYTESDLRVLDLAAAVLKMRASQVLNQSDQHEAAGIAALQRAMSHDFEAGERPLMADWLKELHSFKGEGIEKAIQSSFGELLADVDEPIARLKIAVSWSQWDLSLGNPESGVDRLVEGIKLAMATRRGRFTDELTNSFNVLLQCYQAIHHYREAGEQIQFAIGNSMNNSVRGKLILKACDNFNRALQHGGATTLGEGNSQYGNVREWMVSAFVDDRNESVQSSLADKITQYHYTAFSKKIKNAGSDLRRFGKEQIALLVDNGTNYAGNMVGAVADRIEDIDGRVAGIEFIVEMLEREPLWVPAESNFSIWDRCGYNTYRWRSEAKSLPAALEDRLLSVQKATLAQQLSWRGKRYLDFCRKEHSDCWNEKLGEFQKIVEAFIDENSDTVATVVYGAEFIGDHIGNYRKASEILSEVNRTGDLETHDRITLGKFLERSEQWAKSAEVHQKLISDQPDDVTSHVRLTRAFFYGKKTVGARTALEKAHEVSQHEEDYLAVARVALEIKEPAVAISSYEKAIRKHETSRPNRGIGDGTVSGYYRELAKIYSQLGQTDEAVAAASAAIVSWGDNRRERTRAMVNLRSILSSAEDLDTFAKQTVKEAEETGMENAVLRKALGMVYLEGKRTEEAIRHLTVAVELEPGDTETHLKLIEALDAGGKKDVARLQLIEAIKQSPREFPLIRDLRKRYMEAENSQDAERAATHLVESTPNEAESHHELAKVRMAQQKWTAALGHWKRVAELREREPTGLIGQIRTRISEGEKQAARELHQQLTGTKWPSRFANDINSVRKEVDAL